MIAMRILIRFVAATLFGVFALSAGAAAEMPVPREKPEPPPQLLRDARGAALRTAFERADRGRLEAAQAALPDLSEMAPETAELLDELLRWTAYVNGAPADFAAIRRFYETHRDWPRPQTLRRRVEETVTSYTPDEDILAWFSAHPPVTSRGQLHYAEALFRAGKPDEAAAWLRRGWQRARLGRQEERRLLRRYGEHFRSEDHIARVDHLLWQRARSEAYRMLSRLPEDQRLLARARIALIGFAWDVDNRIAAVPEDLQNDAGLVYDRVYWRRIKGKHASARELLLSAPVEGENILRPDRWWRERHYQARRALRRDETQAAYRLAAEHRLLDGYRAGLTETLSKAAGVSEIEEVKTPDLGRATRAEIAEAEWLAGWIALRFLDRPVAAMEHFQTLYTVVNFPVSRSRGAYWAGRAADAMDDPALARRWYEQAARHPTAYYGQLALEKLGGDMSLVERAEVSADPIARERFESRKLVKAARFLGKIGADDPLRDIVRHLTLTAETQAEKMLAAELGNELDRPDVGVIAAKLAARQGDLLLDQGYPVIETPPDLNGTKSLVHAIARQESLFDPEARSHVGALGLMQLMPATALRVARQMRVPYSKQRLLTEPAYNLQLGSHYFDTLMRRYSDSPVLALAAYNAGPAPVNRWLRQYGDPRKNGLDPVDWIELIPYNETRNYVQRVLESASIYDVRFGRDDERAGLARYLDIETTRTTTAEDDSGRQRPAAIPGG